jgi:glutamate N-acetyltransferase/amino-acid N-acetyltransferase
VSVTAPDGFVAASGAIGIKAGGDPDFAVVATADGSPVPAAAVFTQNLAAAAPVLVSREHLAATGGRAAAVVVTSGNANAATGVAGVAAARSICEAVATQLGAATEEVLVCQTGLIGVPFPTGVLEHVPGVVAARAGGAGAGDAASRAILTTDTGPKRAVARAGEVTVGGIAKGAGMLAPHMATMLALLTTDADADPAVLRAVLVDAVAPSFNSLTVDGCTSTNDTVVILASGTSGPSDAALLTGAVASVCRSLAEQMAADAEGATKVVLVSVTGAGSDAEAHQAARRVAGSLLVKCSLNGGDPYWGRVVSELGSAGVAFALDRTSVSYGSTTVCRGGVAAPHDGRAVAEHLAGRHVEILCDLGLGAGSGAVLTTDLGHGYIDENRTTS